MFQILDGAFKGKRGQLVRNTVNTLKNKVFRSGKKNDIKVSGTSIQVSPAKINYRRPSLEQRELSSMKKGDNTSPSHPLGVSRNDDSALQPLKSFNLVDSSKNEKGIAYIQNQNTHNPIGAG
jgi:activator of HSP90 ATPase